MAPFSTIFLTLQATVFGLVQATTLPLLTRKHVEVSITSQLLTDTNRRDLFANDGRPRSIVISTFTPVENCARKTLSPYMPPSTSQFMDSKFSTYGIPNNTFASLNLSTCKRSRTSKPCPSKPFPIVIFSPALGTSRLLYSSLLQNIASAGYIAISIDHPYDADIVTLPNSTSTRGIDIPDSALDAALSVRVEDVQFLFAQLPRLLSLPAKFVQRNTAIVGHSFGGATAASALSSMPNLKGGINIDGSVFGSVLSTGLSQPFLLLGHENKTRDTDPSWATIWPKLRGWNKEFEIKGTQHYAFSDLPVVAQTMGFGGSLVLQQVLGSLEGERVMRMTAEVVGGFLSFVMKEDGGEGLEKVQRDFREVMRVR